MATLPRKISACVALTALCAILVLWVRSGYAGDLLGIPFGSTQIWLRSDNGQLQLISVAGGLPRWSYESSKNGFHGAAPGRRVTDLRLLIFRYASGVAMPGATIGPRSVITTAGPYWMLATFHPIVAAAPLYSIVQFLLRIRQMQQSRRKHLCTQCGYDLRETPQRCPECGTIPQGIASQHHIAAGD